MLLLHTEGKGQSFTQHLVWGPFPPLDHCGNFSKAFQPTTNCLRRLRHRSISGKIILRRLRH